MNHSEKDQLLKEILSGDELARFRQNSLERGLILLHRQQRWRTVRLCALAALPLLLTLGIVWKEFPDFHSQKPDAAVRKQSSVKFITDDELFALFPGRPIALIGKPGQQQLVFLDAMDTGEEIDSDTQ